MSESLGGVLSSEPVACTVRKLELPNVGDSTFCCSAPLSM